MSTSLVPLNQAVSLSRTSYFNYELLVRILAEIDVRLKAVFEAADSLTDAEALLRQVTLARINEVLTPAIQSVLTIQERGFLIARSATSATLGNGNILTYVIGDADERSVFTPSPFVAMTREANTDDWGIARTIGYSNDSGELLVEVLAFAGDEGPHEDWVIGALAGSTIAQYALLAEGQQVLADTITTKNTAVSAKDTAVAAKNIAIDPAQNGVTANTALAADALVSKNSATLSANTAITQAGIATTKAAEAAASALSIAGGPVTSVNSKTGIVYLDPTDVSAVRPTLDFDFRHSKGAPFSGNFTRATVGGYRRRSIGLLTSTAINEPVIDFATDGTPLGTEFYGAYTNLTLRSEEFDNAAWAKLGTAIATANQAISPDGAATGDRLTIASGYANRISQGAIAVTGGSTVTFSVWLKSGSGTGVNMQVATNGGTYKEIVTLKPITSYWERYDVTLTTNGDNTGVYVILYGDGSTSAFDAWGAQLTATAFPVPYVPTAGSTVTRNADLMALTGSNFSDWFNPSEGLFYCEFIAPPAGSGDSTLFQCDDGTDSNRILIRRNAGGSVVCYVIVAGSSVAALSLGTPTPGSVSRVAFSFAVNSFIGSLNGATTVTDTSGALPAVNRLRMATNAAGAEVLNSYIRRLFYKPKAHNSNDVQRTAA